MADYFKYIYFMRSKILSMRLSEAIDLSNYNLAVEQVLNDPIKLFLNKSKYNFLSFSFIKYL